MRGRAFLLGVRLGPRLVRALWSPTAAQRIPLVIKFAATDDGISLGRRHTIGENRRRVCENRAAGDKTNHAAEWNEI